MSISMKALPTSTPLSPAHKADANLDHRVRSPCHWETVLNPGRGIISLDVFQSILPKI